MIKVINDFISGQKTIDKLHKEKYELKRKYEELQGCYKGRRIISDEQDELIKELKQEITRLEVENTALRVRLKYKK